MIAEGRKAQMRLSDGRLTIRSKGMLGNKRAEQSFSTKSIRQIHYREAGLRLGFIYFDTGTIPTLSTPSYQAADRRNGMEFSKEQQVAVKAIKDHIEAERT